jgi:exportin-2 (importin alpha re-exporter)
MMGISIRRESAQGVSEVNQAVNVMEFFQSQILPELQDPNLSARPVLKATSIKFVTVFRNQFMKQDLVVMMPMLIAHLSSPVVVVHTFSAYAIERILLTKEDINVGTSKLKFGSSELKPVLDPLFNGLFAIIDNQANNENDYVMKCVMRSLATAQEDIIPVAQVVTKRLTETLGRIAKNPQNPQFNHFLFESIGVLVRSVCSKDPNATILFEALLFVPFNAILQQDIAEFTPYVFQILAQLLEYRAVGSGLGEAYSQLFPPLLTPALWEKKGNVPALARLFQAYIDQAAAELVPKLNPILGVFQKLLASKATEASAFDILHSVISQFPPVVLEPVLPTLFQLLLVRLQSSKTPRYTRLVTSFFALFAGKFGAQAYFDRLNSMQPNLGTMLVLQIWGPRLVDDPPLNLIEAKMQVIGVTKMLCESATLLTESTAWGQLFVGMAMLLTSGTFKTKSAESWNESAESEVAYDAQYSRLVFASKVVEDPFVDINDPTAFFVQSIHQLVLSNPAHLQPLIQEILTAEPKLSVGLEALFTQAGLRLA